LPGVITARMLEEMMEGYENAFDRDFHEESESKRPESIRLVSKQASAASWKTLAKKRIEDTRPAYHSADVFGLSRRTNAGKLKSCSTAKRCASLRPCFGQEKTTRA